VPASRSGRVTWIRHLNQRAKELEGQTYALCLACKHPGTPWYAKTIAVWVMAYALSPIDLIPDFIPVLGYLDDLIIVPLGIALVVRLVPKSVMAECRAEATRRLEVRGPPRWIAGAVIIAVWLGLAALGGWAIWRWFDPASALHASPAPGDQRSGAERALSMSPRIVAISAVQLVWWVAPRPRPVSA